MNQKKANNEQNCILNEVAFPINKIKLSNLRGNKLLIEEIKQVFILYSIKLNLINCLDEKKINNKSIDKFLIINEFAKYDALEYESKQFNSARNGTC